MSMTCSMHVSDENFIQNFGQKILREEPLGRHMSRL
jgi:hypothetical protein